MDCKLTAFIIQLVYFRVFINQYRSEYDVFDVQFNGGGSLCVLLAEKLTLVFSMCTTSV